MPKPNIPEWDVPLEQMTCGNPDCPIEQIPDELFSICLLVLGAAMEFASEDVAHEILMEFMGLLHCEKESGGEFSRAVTAQIREGHSKHYLIADFLANHDQIVGLRGEINGGMVQ